MSQAVDHIEIRYRQSDTVGSWTTMVLPQGQLTFEIDDLQRGLTYQIEARAVGANGGASVWVQQTHTVADTNQLPVAPTSLSALSVADGVHLTWVVGDTQRADVEYDVERTNDLGGSPNTAGWVNIANVKATAYTDGITDGIVRWYRVRAVDFQGLATVFSNDVNSQNKSVADGADVTSLNIPAEMLINGSFAQGLSGWTITRGSPVIDTSQHKVGSQTVRFQGGNLVENMNLMAGHTYLFQAWVMTDGSVLANGSQGAGIYIGDPAGQITIQKALGTAVNLSNQNPGVVLAASGATAWTLLQATFMVATTGTYVVALTDIYGASVGSATHTWFDGVSLMDTTGGADVTAAQALAYAGSSESIVPNGNFLLGTMQGWDTDTFTYGLDGFGPRIYSTRGHAFSPSFNVVPGQKYRLNYRVYGNPGSGGIFLRLAFQANYADVIVPASTNNIDFLIGGTAPTTPTVLSYDWTCPPNVFYASMCIYAAATGGTSDLACEYVSCIPYSAAGEWGADVTSNNTANNTNNVGTRSSTDVQNTVNPGGGVDLSNPGNTNVNLDHVGDGVGRYASVEVGADKTLNHVILSSIGLNQTAPGGLTLLEVPGMSWAVTVNDPSDVFSVQGSIMWTHAGSLPGTFIHVWAIIDADVTKYFGGCTDYDYTSGTPVFKVATFFGSCNGLSAGAHTITLYYTNVGGATVSPSGSVSFATLTQISS